MLQINANLTDKSVLYITIGGTATVAIIVTGFIIFAEKCPKQLDNLTDAVADIICNQRRELPSAA